MDRIYHKGATLLDQLAHKLYDSKNNGGAYIARDTGVRCGRCGHELQAHYCEERLYIVDCGHCKIKSLVKANSPKDAAYRTLAWDIYDIESMGIDQDTAVFFDHVPIDEPPVYVGSVLDCDLPENALYGMYLPVPGTDGGEYKEERDRETN